MEEEDDEKGLVLHDGSYGKCYRIIGAIGYGEWGRVVYKATDEDTCIYMVVYVKESDSEAYQDLLSQSFDYYSCYSINLDRHSNLNDPILGPLMRFRSKEGYYCMACPYMRHGSLLSLMCRRFPRGLPELFILYALFTTLRAVSAIHTHNQCHRQVSAAHIYVDGVAPNLWVMLGYAATVYDDQTSTSTTKVWRWAAAPEVYGSSSSDDATNDDGAKADIWLVGITALELAYGGLRVESRDELEKLITNMQRMRKLPNKLNQQGRHCWTKGKTRGKRASSSSSSSSCSCLGGLIPKKTTPTGYEYRPEEWVFSKGFVDFVLLCLHLDPTKRPTATDLLQYTIFDTVRRMASCQLWIN